MAPISPLLFLFLCTFVRAEMNSSQSQPTTTASIVNASSQSFPNISSTSASSFSYIIPYNQTQDCNIFGPICQTGSITVDVNLTTATTATVLPCSSYLSAQSSYLRDLNPDGCFYQPDPNIENDPLGNWERKFGESKDCRAYANAIDERQQTISYSISDCGSNTTFIQAPAPLGFDSPWPLPPGFSGFVCDDHTFTCCGDCSLTIPEVRLFYFPDKTDIDCQNNQTSNLTSVTSAPIQKRVQSLVASGSTAIVSGYTFTSPSVYLELMGTATVLNECGTLGPRLINPMITLSPGALSTWQPPHNQFYTNYDYFMIGEPWEDPGHLSDFGGEEEDGISPLDVNDLACPTWGLGKSTATDGSVTVTIGPPWLPLIVPPMEIFSLDPTWESACTGMFSGAYGLTTFAIFDPPIALTPGSLLVPPTTTPIPAPADPTTVPQQTTSSEESAKPASLPNPLAPPTKTRDPGGENPTPSPVEASADPVEPIALPGSPTASPGNKGDPPADPSSDPSVPLVAGDPPTDPNQGSSSSPDPLSDDPHTSSTNPDAPAAPLPQQGESQQMETQGLGAFIYNAFGKDGPQYNPTNDNNDLVDGSAVAAETLTIAGQELVPNPSGMVIGGSTLLPGGSAVTISNTFLSLGTSGIFVVGSSTMLLPTQPEPPSFPPSATKAMTVAGQSFIPNPSAFSIAGTTISAGGPAVTVSGTVISLGPSGALAIGSSTTNLLAPVVGQTYTTVAAGQKITLLNPDSNPAALSAIIAGKTISAGGPAVTVDGTTISIQPTGALVVGSSTIPVLLAPQSTFSSDATATTIDGFNVQVEPSGVVVDGVTITPGAAGVTISGKLISLETGGSTLDIGTDRFALPISGAGGTNKGSINVQAFTGGQRRRLQHVSLSLVCCCICAALMLLLLI